MTVQWCFTHNSGRLDYEEDFCLDGQVEWIDTPCDVAEMIPIRASDLHAVDGEVWGGFYDGEWEPPTKELKEGRYAGRWYWQYYAGWVVWRPQTHIVNHLYNDGEPVKVGGER